MVSSIRETLLPFSNSSIEHPAQPNVNESYEQSGETHTQTVLRSVAEPTLSRTLHADLPARFKDFVIFLVTEFSSDNHD